MSASGHKRTLEQLHIMSALPPTLLIPDTREKLDCQSASKFVFALAQARGRDIFPDFSPVIVRAILALT